MDEKLQRQLLRQLKILNFWITFFGVLFLVSIGIIGFLLFQVITFARDTGGKIDSLEQTTTEKLDVKAQICGGSDSLSNFIRQNTDACT